MYHLWDCSFHVQFVPKAKFAALMLTEIENNDEGLYSEEEFDPVHHDSVVAIWIDPPFDDKDLIARTFLKTYKEQGGKFIDYFKFEGEFDLHG